MPDPMSPEDPTPEEELDKGEAPDAKSWTSVGASEPGPLAGLEDQDRGELDFIQDPGEAVSQNVLDVLRIDHQRVRELFDQYDVERLSAPDTGLLAEQICVELEIHGQLEEEIVYPALQAVAEGDTQAFLVESFDAHADVKRLITELRGLSPEQPEYGDVLRRIVEDVSLHIEHEEKLLFPFAFETLGEGLIDLGQRLIERKEEILAGGEALFPGAVDRLATGRDGISRR